MHMILRQNFDPSFKNMMVFIQYAVFNFPEGDYKATGHMKAILNELQ